MLKLSSKWKVYFCLQNIRGPSLAIHQVLISEWHSVRLGQPFTVIQ